MQRRKRQYWIHKQNKLLNSCENPDIFWKTIGKTGMGNERNKEIPMEKITGNGNLSKSKEDILSKWKSDFSNLYNQCSNLNKTDNHEEESTTQNMYTENDMLNRGISILDVRKAVQSLHKNKSSGYDTIPTEVLQSGTCVHFLHRHVCVCGSLGVWHYNIFIEIFVLGSKKSNELQGHNCYLRRI